jgi:hypothetical protein
MTTSRSTASFACLFGLLLAAAASPQLACAGADGDMASRESALGVFSGWNKIRMQTHDAPALAKVGITMTAVGYGAGELEGQIVMTSQTGKASWDRPKVIPNSGPPFLERPAVVGFAVTSGPLVNHFALIARRSDNNGYYIRIQNQTGSSVIQDWTRIGGGIYASGPAAAFVPPGSLTGPQATLVVVGLGLDNRFWQATNTLVGNETYSHAAWMGPNVPFPEQTFVSAPAIAYACPRVAGVPSLVAAGRTPFSNYVMASGNSTGWTGWVPMNGTFESGPAIGVGCSATATEISVYGRQADDRIWAGVYKPGVPNAGFTPMGTMPFVGSPTAAGFNDTVTVAANGGIGGITPSTNSAQSPPRPPAEGLVLWLKGDVGLNSSGGLLTSWLDQAGQNQHIDQVPGAKPSTGLDTIDGIPAVTFPSGDSTAYAYHAGAMKDRNGTELTGTHARTVMAVIKPRLGGVPASVIGGPVIAMADRPNVGMADNPNFECLFDVEPWGGHQNAWFVFDNLWPLSGYQRLAPDTPAATWNGVPVLGEWRSSGFPAIAFAVNGGSDQPLKDGANVPTTNQAGAQGNNPASSFMIGNAWNNTGFPHPRNFHGAIAEILVWDYDLSTSPATRAAAKAYLATRYPSLGIVP